MNNPLELNKWDLEHVANPEWDKAGKVHDWRNYVPEWAMSHWNELPKIAKQLVYHMAERQAAAEEWE